MGSRITRSIYKDERSKKPAQEDIKIMGRFFCYFLSLFSAVPSTYYLLNSSPIQFAIGYIRDLDLLLKHPQTSKAQVLLGIPQIHQALSVQKLISLSWPVLAALWTSVYSPNGALLASSIFSLVSQFLLWLIYTYNHNQAIAWAGLAQLLATICHHTILICTLKLTNEFFRSAHYRAALFAGILGAAHLGEHWSNHLVPIHKSISAVYSITLIFSVLATMSVVMIVAIYKIGADPKDRARSRILEKKGWKLVPQIIKTKLKISWGQMSRQSLLLILLGGVSVGLTDQQLSTSYFNNHFLAYFGISVAVVILSICLSQPANYRVQTTMILLAVHLLLSLFINTEDNQILFGQYHTQITTVIILAHLGSFEMQSQFIVSVGFFQTVTLIMGLLSVKYSIFGILLGFLSLTILRLCLSNCSPLKVKAIQQGYSQLRFQPVETNPQQTSSQ